MCRVDRKEKARIGTEEALTNNVQKRQGTAKLRGEKMDRTKYLTMARDCAIMCDEGVFHILQNVPKRLLVSYNGKNYYPFAYELSFDHHGAVRHIAIIHELETNAVLRVPLADLADSEDSV